MNKMSISTKRLQLYIKTKINYGAEKNAVTVEKFTQVDLTPDLHRQKNH